MDVLHLTATQIELRARAAVQDRDLGVYVGWVLAVDPGVDDATCASRNAWIRAIYLGRDGKPDYFNLALTE